MKFLYVLYYYYFIFYKNIVPENQPHATAVFTLGVSQSFLFNAIINYVLAYSSGISLGKWYNIVFAAVIIFLNYLFYHRSGRYKEILKSKPKLLNSHQFSIIFVLMFFVLTFLLFLYEPIYTSKIIKN